MTFKTYHQGDINFTPLEAFGKSAADVSTANRLRAHKNRLLIQEGEITGHHHGVWNDVAVMERQETKPEAPEDLSSAKDVVDGLMAKLVAGDLATAKLYWDDALTSALKLDVGAPVIGFLVCDEDVTIRHARESGTPTGEHADIKLLGGGYLVTGKREWSASDQRRVQD
jgi:hypothetical protein